MDLENKRSAQKINRKPYKQLVDLVLLHSWLENEDDALTELWNLCEFESEQDLLFSLLKRFKYLTSIDLKNKGKEIADYIVNDWKVDAANTRIVAISDNREADGSLMLIQSIKNKFVDYGWDENNFINNIGSGVSSTKNNWTIILLDDFIGSGKTIERRVNWFRAKLEKLKIENVDLKIVALAALEISKPILDNLKIPYKIPVWINKGISDHYTSYELQQAINDMLNLESKLEESYNSKRLPSFGFQKSEALFAIESFNIPNNVFPIFWWPYLKGMITRKRLFNRL